MKQKFQKILVKYGGIWLFKKYVSRHHLKDDIVSWLIRNNKEAYLLIYMAIHLLSSQHITSILEAPVVNAVMLLAVRKHRLSAEQQALLVQKNNVLLLEAYLCPNGIFDENRRFSTLPEFLFVQSIVKSEKLTGVEIFKTYVDNNYRDLLTADLIRLLVNNEHAFATMYILQKARLRKEQEEQFLNTASDNLIRYYISEHEITSDQAQILLVEQHFELAQLHFNKYKLRVKAQQLYHERRRLDVENRKKS